MPSSRGSKKRSVEQVEELFEKVRAMKRGGDLEGLLVEEIGKVKRLIYEEALEERGKLAASSEADFSPSDMSTLRRGSDAAGGESKPDGCDVER
jgi:hypothetical protein